VGAGDAWAVGAQLEAAETDTAAGGDVKRRKLALGSFGKGGTEGSKHIDLNISPARGGRHRAG
jgi:hypothetical protein